jgi:hypothetical protein
MSPITVQLDNRVRLMSALLSLTTWPEQEQAYKPHGIHFHAKRTRDALADAEYHPAVVTMQELMESGLPLDAIMSFSAYLTWPDLTVRNVPAWVSADWPAQIRDFAQTTPLADLWANDEAAWNTVVGEAQRALVPGDPLNMLSRFFGPQDADLVFMPNICYPTSETLGFRDGRRLVCIDPPPIAWGNNAPWPYDDTPADTPRNAFSAYAKILLHEMLDANPDAAEAARKVKLPVPNTFIARHPDWFEQFAVLFVSGVTALYLRETFNTVEAKAYTMMVHKAHGFEALASVIDVLEKYLESHTAGKYARFIDYLPTFLKAMRIAEGLKKV